MAGCQTQGCIWLPEPCPNRCCCTVRRAVGWQLQRALTHHTVKASILDSARTCAMSPVIQQNRARAGSAPCTNSPKMAMTRRAMLPSLNPWGIG